ncbi:MAG: hypothetical protein ABI927_08370, partial [Gaiellaceae bacterium]
AVSVTTSDASVSYATTTRGSWTKIAATRTRDAHVLRVARVKGAFGIPAVTIGGTAGGLSADGRTLVLSQPPSYQALRQRSRFVLLSTATLRPIRTISLRGDFGFDALSPDATTLYLIQHRSTSDPSYSVRAFDLRSLRLLPGAIVDKSEADKTMRGMPVARTASADAIWVYTLYNRDGAEPFVHALNTRERYAVCVDLTWQGSAADIWNTTLEMSADGRQLLVTSAKGAVVARVDTQTLRVVAT